MPLVNVIPWFKIGMVGRGQGVLLSIWPKYVDMNFLNSKSMIALIQGVHRVMIYF